METKTRNKALNAYANSMAIYEYHFNCCDHGGNCLLDPGQETGKGAFQTTHSTSILSSSTETEKQQASFRITSIKLRSVTFTWRMEAEKQPTDNQFISVMLYFYIYHIIIIIIYNNIY
jgi:hypothetical protein